MSRIPNSKTASIEIRRMCMRMLDNGMTQQEVASIANISQGSISLWRKSFSKKGDNGLQRKNIPGRPMKISGNQLRKIIFLLAKGPESFGYQNNLWTLKRISKMIEQELGVKYHVGHVWKILRKLGLTHQKPEKRAVERDEKQIKEWKNEHWPKLSSKARREGKTIVFMDESGRSQTPTVVATWSPCGKTPILSHVFGWSRCSIVSAITSEGGFHYRIYSCSIKSGQILAFLKHLLSHIKEDVILFWDGIPTHKSNIVKNFLEENKERIEVHRLPPYAPETNPDEFVFRYLKYVCVPNSCPKTHYELLKETRSGMEAIRRKPQLIQSFFRTAGLDY